MSFLTKNWTKYQPIDPKLFFKVELGEISHNVNFWGKTLTFCGFIKKIRLKVALFLTQECYFLSRVSHDNSKSSWNFLIL